MNGGGTTLTPDERRQRDSARGRRAYDALLARFEREADPDGTLDPTERARRAEDARKAHFQQLGKRGGAATAQTRKARQPTHHTSAQETEDGHRAPGEPDPAEWAHLWDRPDLKAALSDRDIGAVYRALAEIGVTQRQIAWLTGQSQPEVSAICTGRQVRDVTVLERICDGLGIPRPAMRLLDKAPGEHGAYSEMVTDADPAEAADMLRRHFQHLLALATAAAVGVPVPGIGALADLPTPPTPATVPNRVGTSDVALIRACRQELVTLARVMGGQARASVHLTEWAEQWLAADATDAVRRELLSELADLHVTAAWNCHDCGAVARSHYHFGRAVELANEAGDSYKVAFALLNAGNMLVDRGAPNNALKMLQLGGLRLQQAGSDHPQVPVVQAQIHVMSASALSRLSDSESVRVQARTHLAKARDKWAPPDAHAKGCMDLDTGLTQLHLGRLDTAEATAARAVQTFTHSGDRREGVVADILLARLHVQAGEPRGLTLAKSAIDAVAQTRSGVARQIYLPTLTQTLDAHPSSDAKHLAWLARQLAA